MAYKTSYELHHHFPRLAEESGFTFNTHRPRVHIDWNKIKLIDLDSLIRERKFVLIEQHLNDILDCVFESEFDVRILDEGVMKMFRLAQLAVEYQQFCRHYLDRSVYVLREEITALAQDLDSTKKQLQDREEELRKLKRRSRHSYKTPLPYGNDNIAAMILKTLSNKGDGIFPSTTNVDAIQHNKCSYCDKVFLNQLYLQSHMTRRHGEVLETSQNKITLEQNNENAKMNAEITELRTKLREMEQVIINSNKQNNTDPVQAVNTTPPEKAKNISTVPQKNMKDAEVSTNTEEYLLTKFEQWKTEEHVKYNKEINELRTQILETINSMKNKQNPPKIESEESTTIDQLHITIKEQGNEILKLKQELSNSQNEKYKEDLEKSKETETQILFWSQRAEAQSKQYEALLQKLNDVAKDAKESRALAEMERERATQLQTILQQNINRKPFETVTTTTDDRIMENHANNHIVNHVKNTENKKPKNNVKQMTDRNTLENLHKKAQELLNMGSMSSTSSESSGTHLEEIRPAHKKHKKENDSPIIISNPKSATNPEAPRPKQRNHITVHVKNEAEKIIRNKIKKTDKNKLITKSSNETTPIKTGSPMRVVRAKLTEEVNSRLVSFGVDPLKSRLPRSVFQKQRIELQQLHETKIKKTPSYEKVRHSIIAFLDSNVSNSNKEINGIHEYVSPNKVNKPFRSLTSVISNVKSKALSLVKLNENNKEKRKHINSDIAKRAMVLVNTPPSSVSGSPVNVRHTHNKRGHSESKHDSTIKPKSKLTLKNNSRTEKQKNNLKQTVPKGLNKEVMNHDSEDESTYSDHKYYNTTIVTEASKSVETLIKSPARRPASADTNMNNSARKYTDENGDLFTRTQSVTNLSETKEEVNNNSKKFENFHNENSSDDLESISETPIKKALSNENVQNVKQTKGVLKNASSMSSLSKKKVLFDMDAIQMKSVSASPSQSITEKSDVNEKYELGLVNLDGEEWDISSIENEPLKNDTKIQINTRTSPKIAELKQTIENQLARRTATPSTAIVGGVDILAGPVPRAPSIGGSNTSLGSSILDESDGIPTVSHKAFVKPRKVAEKDDSELDISEFSIDGIANKNESF